MEAGPSSLGPASSSPASEGKGFRQPFLPTTTGTPGCFWNKRSTAKQQSFRPTQAPSIYGDYFKRRTASSTTTTSLATAIRLQVPLLLPLKRSEVPGAAHGNLPPQAKRNLPHLRFQTGRRPQLRFPEPLRPHGNAAPGRD